MNRPTYHHGDLRAVILTAAARLVAERGADQVSLRVLARDAGVSHAAPAHHFTDRRGLFTALATQGFLLLAEALIGARPQFADAALAYVRFAIEHPGHYQVMFNKSLLDNSDAELAAAEAAAGAELSRGVTTLRDRNARADPAGVELPAGPSGRPGHRPGRRTPGTRPCHQQVVEGGTPRRVPRLQPEREGPHYLLRILGAASA